MTPEKLNPAMASMASMSFERSECQRCRMARMFTRNLQESSPYCGNENVAVRRPIRVTLSSNYLHGFHLRVAQAVIVSDAKVKSGEAQYTQGWQ